MVVFELLFLSQTPKILNKIFLKYSGDANSFSFGMQLPKWGEKWLHAKGWVCECCGELDTSTAIPWSDTREYFVGMF